MIRMFRRWVWSTATRPATLASSVMGWSATRVRPPLLLEDQVLEQRQRRCFAAWRPEWKEKKPRAYKLALQRKKDKQREPLRKQMNKVREKYAKVKKYMKMNPPENDNFMGQPGDNQKAENPKASLSSFRMFSSTSSPFVYMAKDASKVSSPASIGGSQSWEELSPEIEDEDVEEEMSMEDYEDDMGDEQVLDKFDSETVEAMLQEDFEENDQFYEKSASDKFGEDDVDEDSESSKELEYWDRPSKYIRSRCAFAYVSKADFGVEQGWPDMNVGEVAFLGRSNVGKSSLMNALMQAKLARTSKLPGRTQHAHYFGMFPSGVNTSDWRRARGFLVDLPGYGFAVGPDNAVSSWQGHTQRYLMARLRSGHLRRLFLLVDSRRAQQSMDWSVLQWLDKEARDLPYSVVFTKADDLDQGPRDLIPHLNTLSMRYNQLFRENTERPRPTNDDGDDTEESENSFDRIRIPDPYDKTDYLNRRGGQSPIFHITSAVDNFGLDELWRRVCLDLESYGD